MDFTFSSLRGALRGAQVVLLLAGSTLFAGCSADAEPGGDEEAADQAVVGTSDACLPFTLAEAGARRALNNERTCESKDVGGWSRSTAIEHLIEAKKVCGDARLVIERIKASTLLNRFLGKDPRFFSVTGQISGPGFTNLETVFAKNPIELEGFGAATTTTLRFAAGGTGVESVGSPAKTRTFKVRFAREGGGVFLDLDFSDQTHARYRAQWENVASMEAFDFMPVAASSTSPLSDVLAGEVGISDLCNYRVTCPATPGAPCK